MDEFHQRRLDRKKSEKIAEANVLLHIVRSMLNAEQIDHGLDMPLQQNINQEQKYLLRANGRIEPRSRFKKKSGHPFLTSRPISTLFIDESGKSNKSNQGVFVLSGISMLEEDQRVYIEKANQIKQKYFHRIDVTFHEPNMRNQDGIFKFNSDGQWHDFNEEIRNLLSELEFKVFGSAIRVDKIQSYFELSNQKNFLPADLYHCGILLMLERYIDYLSSESQLLFGKLVFESQGPKEDVDHQYCYAKILKEGTQWVPESIFRSFLYPGVEFVPKKGSHVTEIADMFARDLFEWVKSSCTAIPHRWELFSKKIYLRGDGKHGKFGVKVFPDSDIRENIETHRKECAELRSAIPQGEKAPIPDSGSHL